MPMQTAILRVETHAFRACDVVQPVHGAATVTTFGAVSGGACNRGFEDDVSMNQRVVAELMVHTVHPAMSRQEHTDLRRGRDVVLKFFD